jgi:hypothetical protein
MQSTWLVYVPQVLLDVCLRSLPCVLYLLTHRSLRLVTRLAIGFGLLVVALLGLRAGADPVHHLALPVLGLGYFALLSLAVFWTARAFAGVPRASSCCCSCSRLPTSECPRC